MEAAKGPTALVSELPQGGGGARIPSTSSSHSRPADQMFGDPTHPRVDGFMSRRIQKALSNRFDEGSLIMHDVQDMGKVPFGLN